MYKQGQSANINFTLLVPIKKRLFPQAMTQSPDKSDNSYITKYTEERKRQDMNFFIYRPQVGLPGGLKFI